MKTKALLWSTILALSYASLMLIISTNMEVFIISFIAIFFLFFKVFKESFDFISSLNERVDDYREFSLLTSHLLALTKLNHNLDSLLVEAYEKYTSDKGKNSKFKILLEDLLGKKIFREMQLNVRNSVREKKLSSPLIEVLWSTLKKLDSIDREGLSEILSLSYQLSRHLYQNARRVKALIKSEKIKFQVLQIATAMTLSFIIKTSFILMKYPLISTSFNPLTLIFFSLTFLLFSSSFVPLLQMRIPSFKELAPSLLAFLGVLAFPTS